MKFYFYIFSWLITLFIGLLLGILFFADFRMPLIFTTIAAIVSAPFIAIFCLMMFVYLKTQPSTSQLHLRTFAVHLVGTMLTAAILTLIYGQPLPGLLYLAIFAYFIIDSILFHIYISAKHEISQEKTIDSNDILDHPL